MNHTYAGIDTHSRFHVIVITDHDGHTLTHATIEATTEGHHQALDLLRQHHTTRVGIEGTSSYGAALANHLTGHGLDIVEVTGPDRATRRRRGKNDLIDAEQAAQAARTGLRTRPAKHNTHLAELRAHYVLRESALKARTQVGNQIHHLQRHLEPDTTPARITPGRARQIATTHTILATAARRWLALDAEARDHEHAITHLLASHHQPLLDQPGVGPITAAALVLAAGANPDRLTGEASFAALCGASPVQASSGNTQRHRLNRGGDRQANRALHTITQQRRRHDPATIAYVERRLAEHKTPREIHRCLKRYICRDLYKHLKTATQTLDTQ